MLKRKFSILASQSLNAAFTILNVDTPVTASKSTAVSKPQCGIHYSKRSTEGYADEGY